MDRRRGERGQTLILFALLATALLGGLAIVVDIGNLYLTRRVMQNVADQAALVGAQNRNGDTLCLNGNDAVRDARIYATKNGVYSNSGVANGIWHPDINNGVRPVWPPSVGNHAGDCGYLEVYVAKTVNSFFAGVIGANPVRVEARAVARGFGGYAEAAIIALKDDPQAIKIGGSSNNVVTGSVYSRGDVFAHSGVLSASGWVYARGTIDLAGLSADSQTRVMENAPDLSDPNWPTPTASASGPGTRFVSDAAYMESWPYKDAWGWKHIWPGTYKEIFVKSNDKVMFHSGVYHVTGGASGKNFKIEGVAAGYSERPFTSPYTDTNPPLGQPVCFVLYDGVTFEITAMGTAHFQSAQSFVDDYGHTKIANNLIIRSLEDKNAVTIVGQGSISMWGTIYAPNGDVSMAGSTGGTVHGQVVGGRVSLLGGAGPVVVYDPARVPATRRTVLVE